MTKLPRTVKDTDELVAVVVVVVDDDVDDDDAVSMSVMLFVAEPFLFPSSSLIFSLSNVSIHR
jgi:hypothetical protein